MDHPRLSVLEVQRFERPAVFRLPFRYGAVTLTETSQAFVRVRVRLTDGREGWGQAAELLAPKWFDKSPDLSNDDNVEQLRAALHIYAGAMTGGAPDTAFGHFASRYRAHLDTCAAHGLNPLVASFGPALIDRAVLDALCRLLGIDLAEAIMSNVAAIAPGRLAPDLDAVDFDAFLASLRPLSAVAARHTVGLIDPLTAADLSPEDRVDDGLPEALDEVIAHYGNTHFKIKIGGDIDADRERLRAVAAVLDSRPEPYVATLDGNEQFADVEPVIGLLAALRADPSMRRFCQSLLFVEQPIRRASALACDVSPLSAVCPVIIDESDEDLNAFVRARDCGYRGVSTKDCKGFYKSLINLARCRAWSSAQTGYVMSAEDLSCQAGLALQQDLALVSVLGIDHVERNGHHYVRGMAGVSRTEQEAFLAAHPDIYGRVEDTACLRIGEGRIDVASTRTAGFGTSAVVDWSAMKRQP